MKKSDNRSKGFTLVELLVVLSIISLLSSIILGGVSGYRLKGQDAKVISEVRNLRTALELYYNKYGYYPSTSGTYTCTAGTGSNSCTPGTGVLQALVTEGFISKVPIGNGADGNGVDPQEIYYGSPGWWNSDWGYQIQFQVNNRNDSLGECSGACPTTFWSGYYTYSIHPF